jgi:hypothetical protein
MSSQRRIDSSRANGARSHSLTAKTVVLGNEDTAKFEALLDRYTAHFDPIDPIAEDLIEELAVSKWRQRRIRDVETATIDVEMVKQEETLGAEFAQFDETVRIALAIKSLTDNSKILSYLSRYEGRQRQAYERALQQLQAEKITRTSEPSPISEQLAA